jgi:cytochrome c peroxidase
MIALHRALFVVSLVVGSIAARDAASEVAVPNAMKERYRRPTSVPYPKDNAYTKEREQLGKMLFFDPRLSSSGVMSCATCHNPSFAYGDGLPVGVGHGHKSLARRTPTVLNLAWAPKLFWDGRAASLEEQALGPIASAAEMNMVLADVLERLKKIEGYQTLAARAYPGEEFNEKVIARAIATYERGIVSATAPFDRWIAGDETAISKEAKRGFVIFNTSGKCSDCHSGWNFTDHSFQDVGINDEDIGRAAVLPLKSMQHAFKTPGLRNVDQRGPYMHHGKEETLKDVIEFYDRGGDAKRPSVSASITSLGLSGRDKTDLEAFLHTLTSEDPAVELPVLPR